MSFKKQLKSNKVFNKLFEYNKVAKVNKELGISFKQFQRFLDCLKIEKGLVIWSGPIMITTHHYSKNIPKKYGRFRWYVNGKQNEELAHRLFMMYIKGKVLKTEEHVKHDIGVSSLVLNKTKITNNKTNMEDKAFDETHKSQKLTADDAYDIITSRMRGMTPKEIKVNYDYISSVTISTVSRIDWNRNWGQLKRAMKNFLKKHSLDKMDKYVTKNSVKELYERYG